MSQGGKWTAGKGNKTGTGAAVMEGEEGQGDGVKTNGRQDGQRSGGMFTCWERH